MDTIPSSRRAELESDIIAAWTAIDNGVVDQNTKTREKYWAHWSDYTAAFHKDPFLRGCTNLEKSIIVTAFAARVRTGHYGRKNQVKVQSVADALSAITKTHELAGEPSPVLQAPGTYTVPVARLVEGFRREDPPPVAQIAVPVGVPCECRRRAYLGTCPKDRAIGDLAVIAFFYLLRVGEYTITTNKNTPASPRKKTARHQRTTSKRTVQFHIGDVGFFKDGKILPRNSPLPLLLQADEATLKITNQKNGRMGQTIHHHAVPANPNCPIKALARRVHAVLSNGGTSGNLLCDYYNPTSLTWHHVTSKDMLTHVRAAITSLGLPNRGITPDLVGVHSLRAGGAMALKLQGFEDTTIMKFGRWTSLTFLQYIHNQIAHLSMDVSTKMSLPIPFTNIAAIERW